MFVASRIQLFDGSNACNSAALVLFTSHAIERHPTPTPTRLATHFIEKRRALIDRKLVQTVR